MPCPAARRQTQITPCGSLDAHSEIITITGKSYRLKHRGEVPKPAKAPTGSKKNEKHSKPAKAPTGSEAEKEEQKGLEESVNQPAEG